MDIKQFHKMFNDKDADNLKKMKYKYPQDFSEYLKTLKALFYIKLPLLDENDKPLVFVARNNTQNNRTLKLLLQYSGESLNSAAVANEIISTGLIENIDYSRDSVKNILKGYAPANEEENRINGLKKGLEFISNAEKITEKNIFKLYNTVIGDYLDDENKLKKGKPYRHDDVYVMSDHIEYVGINHTKVANCMSNLVDFINADDEINDLVKASIIHFYFCYVHPYFDGNGRMARLIHLWFLMNKGYKSALFLPFSASIEKTRKKYYDSYTLVEQNKKISKFLDVTPFISYVNDDVYNKIKTDRTCDDITDRYNEALKQHEITRKESELWRFVLSYYGEQSFSTKQLEKDFGDVAYATVRSFVLKFTQMNLLTEIKFTNKSLYKIGATRSVASA